MNTEEIRRTLKARAYDLIVFIEAMTNELRDINAKITELGKAPTEPKATVIEGEVPQTEVVAEAKA